MLGLLYPTPNNTRRFPYHGRLCSRTEYRFRVGERRFLEAEEDRDSEQPRAGGSEMRRAQDRRG